MSQSFETFKESSIGELFKTMNDSPASPSHSKLAEQWLKNFNNKLTSFVSGNWSQSSSDNKTCKYKFTENVSAVVEFASAKGLDTAVDATVEGFKAWQKCNAVFRSKILFKIAQSIEQQSKLLNGMGSLTSFGSYSDKLTVPYLIDSFNYCAGLAGDKEFSKGWTPYGVVCIFEDVDYPIWKSVLWQITSILASGNAVLLLVNVIDSLNSLLLAEICHSAGLPSGVFNVVLCNSSSFTALTKVDKILLSGTNRCKQLISMESNMCITSELLLHAWPTAMIYESADLDAAINSILHLLIVKECKYTKPAYVINVQESILKTFIMLLGKKICSSVGENAAYGDTQFYIMGNKFLVSQLQNMLSSEVTRNHSISNGTYPLCTSVLNVDDLMDTPAVVMSFNSDALQEKDQKFKPGPGAYIQVFRTVKESIAMFNANKVAPDVSIWTEEMHLALEVASKLKAKTVWVNSTYLFEPSAVIGSVYLRGHSVIGGKEGFFNHMLIQENDNIKSAKSVHSSEIESYKSAVPSNTMLLADADKKQIKKNMKLFIGGSFTNASEEMVQVTLDSENKQYASISSAKKSDVDKAVSSANSSQPKWEGLSKFKRAGILRKASDLLNKRKEEFTSELHTVLGLSKENCSKEVEKAVDVLFSWANHISHFEGQVLEAKLYGKVIQEHQPLGVIGIQCPDREPLLSFVFLVAPAIAFGNAVVAIASEQYPTCSLMMCEAFQAAGLPGGILNVIVSNRSYLTRQLTTHLNVDAMWFSEDGGSFIYNSVLTNQPKKVFNCKNLTSDLSEAKKLKFLYESTYSRAIFLPMGTGYV